jgi:signal transduction histidine kinase
MRLPHTRLTLPARLRLPHRTARLRLTALYGGLFLVCGATLLTITYFLFERASSTGGTRRVAPTTGGLGFGPTAQQLHAEAAQRASTEAAQRASDLHQLLINSGIALGIVALVAIVLGWLVAGQVLRPVRDITATARKISATNLHERLALAGADEEFKQLGDTLDDLFARLEASFEAQRHFVANAAHELRTPLTRERTLLQVTLGDPATSEVWQLAAQELLASNREQDRLVDGLLTLASGEGGLACLESVDLSVVCHDVLLRPDLDVDQFGLSIEPMIAPAPLDGDPTLIEHLVANLVDNAIKHNVVGGHIRIFTGTTDNMAVLSISNSGPMIPASEIARLFQPFQRLDPGRTHKSGHGLGLSIVQAIASAHGAAVTACPNPTGGLSVNVTFPTPRTPQGRSPRSCQRSTPEQSVSAEKEMQHAANPSLIQASGGDSVATSAAQDIETF